MPSINLQSLGAKADYLCLPAKCSVNLNRGKGYDLETLFGLKKFYYVHSFGADRTINVYSTTQSKLGEKGKSKTKFSFLKMGHILYRYISMYSYQEFKNQTY